MIECHLSGGFNDRRITPTGIVIHYISARYTKPDDPYDPDEIIRILEEYGLAYHDLITREGEIIELVPAPLRAWHAGESSWHGREGCNDLKTREVEDDIRRDSADRRRERLREKDLRGY